MSKAIKYKEEKNQDQGEEYVSRSRYYAAIKGRKQEELEEEDEIEAGLREYRERNHKD